MASKSTRKTTTNDIDDVNRRGLIDYVDFGRNANRFLLGVGVLNGPTPSILAELLIDRQANYFSTETNDKVGLENKVRVYIDYLKQLAVAAAYSNELHTEPIKGRLITSVWCLGFENTVSENGQNDSTFKIVKPEEVYLDDSPLCAMAFRPILAPPEKTLFKLYERFGSKWLSECIERTMIRTGAVNLDRYFYSPYLTI